jgi:hypothetical protein
MLLARLFESLPLAYPRCAPTGASSPYHRGVPGAADLTARDDGLGPLPSWEAMAQPESEYVFDQQVHW